PRPFANNNQWAASLGGPLKKDKTFFFFDTEGIRYIVPSTDTVQIPTAQFLSDTLLNLVAPPAPYAPASLATTTQYKAAQTIWNAAGAKAKGATIFPIS